LLSLWRLGSNLESRLGRSGVIRLWNSLSLGLSLCTAWRAPWRDLMASVWLLPRIDFTSS